MKKALLIDLDGVLRIGNKPAPYLNEFLMYLTDKKIKACVISNSSLYSSKKITKFFSDNSFKLNLPIITTVDTALNFVGENYNNVAVYTSDEVKKLFSGFLNYSNPEAVLIGDIGNKWNYEIMQEIFTFLKNGAALIAMHKNKFWNKAGTGLQLDAGTFIHGLEFAANVKAKLLGKPSKLYFQSALTKLGIDNNSDFIMLGDDLDTDITGAKKLDAKTILIFTGKTTRQYPDKYKNYVDFEAGNLLDVINILESFNK